MSEHVQRAEHKPALAHLFWWFMFAQGGVLAAVLIPVHILVQGILGPLGIVTVVDRHYDTWISILGNPIVKLYLLVDLGVPAAKTLVAQVIFYGGAVVVTVLAIYVLLTTAPLSFG